MQRLFLVCLSFTALIFASGCTMTAPQYSASIGNVQNLKDKGIGDVKVSEFQYDEKSNSVNDFSLRGSSLKSPYDDSYAAYLAAAIKQELSLAGKLAPNSNTDISCFLLKNRIDASGFSTGAGDIEARFIVTRDRVQRYNEVMAAHTEWPSSFLGAVALPRAQEEYPRLVQKLLENLYADPKFIQALK